MDMVSTNAACYVFVTVCQFGSIGDFEYFDITAEKRE